MSWHTRFRRRVLQLAIAAGACGLFLSPATAVTYFEDDFNSYSDADDSGVTGAGWLIYDTGPAIESSGGPHGGGANWTIMNSTFKERGNPASIDGTPTTGHFMVSDSDGASGNDLAGEQSSYNLETPSFSTGDSPWLHIDVAANLNNNGLAVFLVESSTDGGANWTERFVTMAPGRANFAGTIDQFPTHSNTGGYLGRLDVDLGAASANQADVRVRLRQYEPNDDWWIAVDNVKVDDVPRLSTGGTIAYSENFNTKTLGTMSVLAVTTSPGAASLGITEQWATADNAAGLGLPFYFPGDPVGNNDGRAIERSGHNDPDPAVGPNFEVPFAITQGIIATAGADTVGFDPEVFDTVLHTPVVDLSDATEVILEYDSENYNSDGKAQVVLKETGGDGVDAGDAIVAMIFDYNATNNEADGGMAGRFPGEEPMFAERIFSVPEAAGRDDVYFAWEYSTDLSNPDGDHSYWWAIDNINVSYNAGGIGGDFDNSGIVDGDDFLIWQSGFGSPGTHAEGDADRNGQVDGDDFLIWQAQFGGPPSGGASGAVPEPGAIALAVLVGMAFASLRKRRR